MKISTRETATFIEDITYRIDPKAFHRTTGQNIEEVINTAEGDALIESFIRNSDEGVSIVESKNISSKRQLGSFTIDYSSDDLLTGLTNEQIEAAYRHQERVYLEMDVRKAIEDREIKNATDQDVENIIDDFIDNFDANSSHNTMIEFALDNYFILSERSSH